MEEEKYEYLGQDPSIALDYTTKQAEDCPKYLIESGLWTGGGVYTVILGASRKSEQSDLISHIKKLSKEVDKWLDWKKRCITKEIN